MDKHFIYHELKDFLDKDLCPVCALINKNIDRFIDGLLYESVNDVKIRSDIKKSNGFCNYHAWKLQSFGDPLAHAIIYSDLIGSAISNVECFLNEMECANNDKRTLLKKMTSNRSEKLKERIYFEGNCNICRMVKDSEKQYVLAFGEYVDKDAEFREKYVKKGFLCIPHIIKLFEYCEDVKKIKGIMEIQLGKFKELYKHLNEIKRKSDYRFSDEPRSGEEKIAWVKAVKQWVGEPGIQK